jgi:hypothetical protein
MNPFLTSKEERLLAWRSFRQSLEGKTEAEQLHDVAKWYAQAPLSTFVLDFDDPSSWRTPWEVMNDGDFCSTAIAYMMEQTLLLVGWAPERLRLVYVRNMKIQDQMMILLVDDKIALNYVHSAVFNFDNERSDCAYLVQYQPTSEGGHTEV